MGAPRVYSEYDRPPAEGLACPEKSMARQSEADSCDINKIMKRYEVTGELPESGRSGFFADVSALGDYRAVRDNINFAEAAFLRYPPDFRMRFGNDVANFLDFCSDPKNRAEMVELGMIKDEQDTGGNAPPVVPAPVVAPVGAASADASPAS